MSDDVYLRFENVAKHYGNVRAVDDVSIDVGREEFLTLLGASGSGKTTLLMTVAGFTMPDRGRIVLDGEDITWLPPSLRNIGVVFQSYALFPHMTVFQNVAYPLRVRKVPRRASQERTERALELVQLGGFGERMPSQLSGGQQQRVALARAVVFEPRLLLMDEPLGALDKKLREYMQLEIKQLQRQLRITVIYVTHDQSEALTMSDRIAIMNDGRFEQVGSPEGLYRVPANRFVADFIGETCFFRAVVAGTEGGLTVARAGGGTIRYGAEAAATPRHRGGADGSARGGPDRGSGGELRQSPRRSRHRGDLPGRADPRSRSARRRADAGDEAAEHGRCPAGSVRRPRHGIVERPRYPARPIERTRVRLWNRGA